MGNVVCFWPIDCRPVQVSGLNLTSYRRTEGWEILGSSHKAEGREIGICVKSATLIGKTKLFVR